MTLLESRDDNTPLRAAPLSFEYTGVPTRPRLTGRRFFGLLMLVLALSLLGAQLGWASAGLFSNVWQARTEVEYRGNSWTETEDVAVQSRSITGPIAAKYGIEIKEFEEDYTAGLIGGTQILRIEYFDTDPVLAQAIITDIAETYIAEASEQCRFTDCRHVGDEGCAVERLVEPARLASYRKLFVELETT